ncbi:MAG: PilZ domain-containing protein [Acidaminococcales bacterium]|jgi:c-di-GMP-binding flagellar brake protein YcgR|nr:PilZ domain-containing protein [Acidaminococcales bacterium]
MIVIDTSEKLIKEPYAEQEQAESPAVDTAKVALNTTEKDIEKSAEKYSDNNTEKDLDNATEKDLDNTTEKNPIIILSTPAEQASSSAAREVEKPAQELLTPSEWFKPGQKIKAALDIGEKSRIYETKVRKLLPEQLYVDIPVYNNAFVVPAIGSIINGSFVLNNNVYFFETVVLGITRFETYPVWILDVPSEFKRVQRRNSLRMDVLWPVGVRVETKNGIFLPTFKTYCLDISCGGVRYVLDFSLEPGKLVKIEAPDFPGIGSFQAFCEAVRSTKSEYSDDTYWIGSQFVDLPRNIENKIARYIHQIQRRIVINSSAE